MTGPLTSEQLQEMLRNPALSSYAKVLAFQQAAPIYSQQPNNLTSETFEGINRSYEQTDLPKHTGITNQTGLYGETNAGRFATGNPSEEKFERIQGNHAPGIWTDATPFGDPLGTPPQERNDRGEITAGITEQNQERRDERQESNIHHAYKLTAKNHSYGGKKEELEKEQGLKQAAELKYEQEHDTYGAATPNPALRK